MADVWVWFVCGWFGWFVGGLDGLCVSVCVCACVCGRGGFGWSFSKQTFNSFLSTVYHFCFEAGTILRAFNARLGKVDTFLTFITTRKFQQEAEGFNMLLTF